MKATEKATWKKIFADAIASVRKLGLIDEAYSGQIKLNIANGGLADCEKMERIK